MSKVPLCEHGIIIGSINPCKECYPEEKLCCHHLPVGEHCPACDDDERGDQEYHSRRDEEVE